MNRHRAQDLLVGPLGEGLQKVEGLLKVLARGRLALDLELRGVVAHVRGRSQAGVVDLAAFSEAGPLYGQLVLV